MADIEKQKEAAEELTKVIAAVPEKRKTECLTIVKAFMDGMAAQRNMDAQKEPA